jgi:hypothetical protein
LRCAAGALRCFTCWAGRAPCSVARAPCPVPRVVPCLHQVWVYRNSIKALNWFSSIRTILDDPDYAPWFLKFVPGGVLPNGTWHVPACDNNFKPPKCSALYHDQVQSPEYPHGDGSCAQPCDCGKNVRALPAGSPGVRRPAGVHLGCGGLLSPLPVLCGWFGVTFWGDSPVASTCSTSAP